MMGALQAIQTYLHADKYLQAHPYKLLNIRWIDTRASADEACLTTVVHTFGAADYFTLAENGLKASTALQSVIIVSSCFGSGAVLAGQQNKNNFIYYE
jgi:hypothetical protein